MTPRKKLWRVKHSCLKNLSKIEQAVAPTLAAYPALSARQVDHRIALACIELLNTWSNFGRAYYLCGVLRARTVAGHRISMAAAVTTMEDAIVLAVNALVPPARAVPLGTPIERRNEPKWYVPGHMNNIFAAVGHSYATVLRDANSYALQTLEALPVARNYFAHRNESTMERALRVIQVKYGIVAQRPADAILQPALTRPVPLIIDWTEDIKFAIEYICN